MKLIKLGKVTSPEDDNIPEDIFLHLTGSVNYATLCGIGEEDFREETFVEGKLTCPDCLKIVDIVKTYLKNK